MKMTLVTGAIALAIIACSAPTGESNKVDEYSLETRDTIVVNIDTTYKMIVSDTSNEYLRYSRSINDRFSKNEESLKKMKKNFNAEDSRQRIKFDQEIFDMNKKNVHIKSKANDSKNHNKNTWDFFKTSTNTEMNELEKSINALSQRKM